MKFLQNYDFYRYLKDGYQEFNSYKIEQIPFDFRKNQDQLGSISGTNQAIGAGAGKSKIFN